MVGVTSVTSKPRTTKVPDRAIGGERVELRVPSELLVCWRVSASVAGMSLFDWILDACEGQALSPDDIQLVRDRHPDRAKLG